MGTKATPGDFDCHTRAEDDEPIFTLRANDRHAAATVRYWANLYRAAPEHDEAKHAEALACSEAMMQWHSERHGTDAQPISQEETNRDN